MTYPITFNHYPTAINTRLVLFNRCQFDDFLVGSLIYEVYDTYLLSKYLAYSK